MAKLVHHFTLKGKLEFEDGRWVIIEEDKTGEMKYSLNNIIEEFFNQQISITIKRESVIENLVEDEVND